MYFARVLLLILFAVFLSGCGATKVAETEKIKVVTSIYPMAEFVRVVGGERVQNVLLVPTGVEAHDWEPAAKDLKNVQQAALFIYNGGGMEPWATKLLASIGDKKGAVLEAGKGLFAEQGLSEKDSDHDHGSSDPHVWLDPVLAIKQVEAIRDALIKVDAKGADVYGKNAALYIKELEKLHADYLTLSAKSKGYDVVTMHAAFNYLVKRYGWQQISLLGIEPHAEPAPVDLANLIKTVKGKDLKYIFVEPQMSEKLMQEVAKQTGSQLLILDPLENPSPDKDSSYLAGMRRNMANLERAFMVSK